MAAKQFAELNAAYHCLTDPKSTIAAFAGTGTRGEAKRHPADSRPAWRICLPRWRAVCRDADGFLAEKAKVTSPLLHVQFFERGQDWIEKLNVLQKELNELREQVTGEIKIAR